MISRPSLKRVTLLILTSLCNCDVNIQLPKAGFPKQQFGTVNQAGIITFWLEGSINLIMDLHVSNSGAPYLELWISIDQIMHLY